MPHFGIDIDGVLVDPYSAFLLEIHRETGRVLRVEDASTYDFGECFGLDRGVMDVCWARMLESQGSTFLLRPGAAAAIEEMASRGTVEIVTARNSPRSRELTEQWLLRTGLTAHGLTFESRKTKLAGRLSLMIDDRPETIISMAAAGVTSLAMDWPWNRSLPSHRNIHRVRNWADVSKFVKERF